jgi:exonuclease III
MLVGKYWRGKIAMRIMTWNCQGGLRRKQTLLDRVGPDIVIVQECSHDDVKALHKGTQLLWESKQIGPASKKGLGVISLNSTVVIEAILLPTEWIALMNSDPGRMDIVIPLEMHAPARVNILAIWSYNNRHRPEMHKLRGPVLCALDFMNEWLRMAPALVIGDFNHHPCFDTRGGKNNFLEHKETLETLGMKSLYHDTRQESHGAELLHTHFWTRRNYYHIDYIFASEQLRKNAVFNIMSFQEMRDLGITSDHVPLWGDFHHIAEESR